jgi:hypothetical protein
MKNHRMPTLRFVAPTSTPWATSAKQSIAVCLFCTYSFPRASGRSFPRVGQRGPRSLGYHFGAGLSLSDPWRRAALTRPRTAFRARQGRPERGP